MSRSVLNTPRKRHGANRASMSSLSNLSAYDASFVTDFERQQVENYPGHLVAGRYYLRPASELGDQSLRSQSGTGFALGSNPYRTDGKPSQQTHWLFQDSVSNSTTSDLILPPSPEADRTWRVKTEQKDLVKPNPSYPQNKLLRFFSLGLFIVESIPGWKIYKSYYKHIHSRVEPLFNILSSVFNIILFNLKKLLFTAFIFLTVPIVWSIFYHTFFLTNANHVNPAASTLKPFQETFNQLKYQRDTIIQKRNILDRLNKNIPWLDSIENQEISPDEIFASITRMSSKETVQSEIDELGYQNLRLMLDPVLDEISQGRFPPDRINLPGSWQAPYSDNKGSSFKNDFTNILGAHPILNFLEFDSSTGSYIIKSGNQEIVKLDLTNLEKEIFFQYNKAFKNWWTNNDRPTGTSFLDYLQATLQPVVSRNLENIMPDLKFSIKEHATYIMIIHFNLINNSDSIYKNTILSKVIGDIFATLAAESLARSPSEELSLPPASQEDKIDFMKLALNVIDFSNPKSTQKFDFALSINGAKIYTWQNDPFSTSDSPSPPSSLKKRHVLYNNLEPGQCWGYSSIGGRLSYILESPITLSNVVFSHPYTNNNINKEFGSPPTSFTLYALNDINSKKSEEDSSVWTLVTEGNFDWSQAALKVDENTTGLHAHFSINWPSGLLPTHKFRIDLGPSHSQESYSCIYHVAFHGALSSQGVFSQGLI